MLRRNARVRREYLFQKGEDAKERATYERKRKVREAIEGGKALPTELRKDADRLRAEIALDDDAHGSAPPGEGIDSEYFNVGVSDPNVLVTTSHDPSSKLTQFLKEVKLLLPNSTRMNRGGHTVREIVETCRADGFSDLVVLQEHRGVPDGLVVSHMPYGPTAYFGLHHVVMRHDLPKVAPISEAYPHLVLHNLTTRMGRRVGTILQSLFPVPKPDSRRVVSLINRDGARAPPHAAAAPAFAATSRPPALPPPRSPPAVLSSARADLISFRHHVYAKEGNEVTLMEAGPRFELKLYQIKLGTIEQTEVENEWVLRPYMNTAKKRRAMGGSSEAPVVDKAARVV